MDAGVDPTGTTGLGGVIVLVGLVGVAAAVGVGEPADADPVGTGVVPAQAVSRTMDSPNAARTRGEDGFVMPHSSPSTLGWRVAPAVHPKRWHHGVMGSRTAPPRRPVAVVGTRYEQTDLSINGVRIRMIDVPARTPSPHTRTLLILPGHTARIEGFDAMVPALSEHHRVVVLDLPGSGYSDRPNRRYTLRYYEDTIIAVLDHLGITQTIPVGGSLGGNLVLRLGHRFPHRFPTLVVWAPGGAWKAKPRLAAITRRLGRTAFWPSVRIQSRFWFHPQFPGRQQALAETFTYYREVLCPGFVKMYWGIAADQLAHSLFDIAPEIEQPTLMLWGDQDNGANMGAGVARLVDQLPNNVFVTFPGARHSLEAEVPDELSAAILHFLAGTR